LYVVTRERERERPEHIVCVKCLGIYILCVIRREKGPNILSVLSLNFFVRNQREKGEGLVTPKTVIVRLSVVCRQRV